MKIGIIEVNVFLFLSIYFPIFVGFYILTPEVDAAGVKYFREHPFSEYTNFSEKLILLTLLIRTLCVRIRWREMLVFRKVLFLY